MGDSKVSAKRENPNPEGTWVHALWNSFYMGASGAKVIADVLRVGASSISQWCNPPSHESDRDAPGSTFSSKHLPSMAQMTRSGDMSEDWLDYLEAIAGRVAVRKPDGVAASPKAAAKTSRAFAALLDQHAASLEDTSPGGRLITREEARAVRVCGDELIRQVMALVLHAEQSAVDAGRDRDDDTNTFRRPLAVNQ